VETKERILNKMRILCSRREYCEGDILKKIGGMIPGGLNEVFDIKEILQQLAQEGFLNERRYANAFSRDKSFLQGWGEKKISYALAQKGIDKEIIKEALAQIDNEKANERLKDILGKKYKTLSKEKDKNIIKIKIFRFALGRGYEYEQIKRVYDIIRTN
jgi:regulatory protein